MTNGLSFDGIFWGFGWMLVLLADDVDKAGWLFLFLLNFVVWKSLEKICENFETSK